MKITRKQAYMLWLTALRSGNYSQAQGKLKTNIAKHGATRAKWGYCCIGLVCQVAIIPHNSEKVKWENHIPWERHLYFDEEPAYITKPTLSFLGMTVNEQLILTRMNDDDKKSFAEIADYIEFKIMPKALARPVNYYVRNLEKLN